MLGLSCNDGTLIGRVAGVTAGGKVTVLGAGKVEGKIRSAGIDAPERKQAFGNCAKESLSDLVY